MALLVEMQGTVLQWKWGNRWARFIAQQLHLLSDANVAKWGRKKKENHSNQFSNLVESLRPEKQRQQFKIQDL